MGNLESSSQYKNIPISPILIKLKSTMKNSSEQRKTEGFLTQIFKNNLKKAPSDMPRIVNPFCPFQIKAGRKSGDDEWMACCFISPFVAIASPRVICDDDSVYYRPARLCGINKRKQDIFINVKQVHVIEEFKISLLILQNSVIELGWVGFSYFQVDQQIQMEPLWIVNHPKKQINEQTDISSYGQVIKKVTIKSEGSFKGQHRDIIGSIFYKLIDQRPYVIGIQTNNTQVLFFDRKIYDKIKRKLKQLWTEQRQRQILSQLEELQMDQNSSNIHY